MSDIQTKRNFDDDPVGYLIDAAREEYAGNNLSFLDNALLAWACAESAGLRGEICRWHFLTHLGAMFRGEDEAHLPADPYVIVDKGGPCSVFAGVLTDEFDAELPITDQERGMVHTPMGEKFASARAKWDAVQPKERDGTDETPEMSFALDTADAADTEEIKALMAPGHGFKP